MRKLRLAFLCSALAASLAAGNSQAAVPDARAKDGVDLFKAFCVSTGGDQTRALTVLGEGNVFAKRLSEASTTALQGRPGGVAWAMSSPSRAGLLLAYNPMGICEVRIAEADQAAVIDQFHALVASLGAGTGGKPEKRSQNGANLTYETFAYQLDGRNAHLAITTSDRRVGEQQHLITFSFVS